MSLHAQAIFVSNMSQKLRIKTLQSHGSLTSELQAVDAALWGVVSGVKVEFEGLRRPVIQLLDEIELECDRDRLRYLYLYAQKLETLARPARLLRDSLDRLAENEVQLAALFLVPESMRKLHEDIAEAELLLSSSYRAIDEVLEAAGALVSQIRDTEEMYVFSSLWMLLVDH